MESMKPTAQLTRSLNADQLPQVEYLFMQMIIAVSFNVISNGIDGCDYELLMTSKNLTTDRTNP